MGGLSDILSQHSQGNALIFPDMEYDTPLDHT